MKLGKGKYSIEITVTQFRTKTFEVAYEKDVGEAYSLIEDRIAEGTLDFEGASFEEEIDWRKF